MLKHELSSDSAVKIARETYASAIEEGRPILTEHWRELALYPDIPLDPNFSIYETLEAKELLALYTVRIRGEMVGYAIYFLNPSHHHYKNHSWAISDIILVRKPFRNFGVGKALFDFVENDLRRQGVHVIHTMTKIAHPELAMLLRARGHQEAELCFSKRL